MKRTAYGLALLALLVPLAASHARERQKVESREPGTRWFTNLDAAIAEAKDRNIPLLVALHKDHWGGCIGMMESVFPSKEMRTLSLEYAGVIAHGNTAHEERDYVMGGKKVHMCSWYDIGSCKEHERMRDTVSQRGLLKDVNGTPFHVIYNPHTMEEIGRANYLATGKFEETVAEAQKKLGKPVTYRDYSKIAKDLDEARSLVEDESYKKALKTIDKFDPKGLKSLETQAAELKAKILAIGGDLLAKARAAADAGETKEAKKLLRTLDREFSGTEVGDAAEKLSDELKEKESADK